MQISLEKLATDTFAIAKSIVENLGQEADPCFVIQTKTELIPVLTPWRNDAERAATFRKIHHMLLDQKAQSYAHVSEGWTLMDEDARKWDGKVRPTNHPNRVECLVVTAYDRDGNGYMMTAVIETKGRRRSVGEPRIAIPGKDGAQISGAAIDLFVPR